MSRVSMGILIRKIHHWIFIYLGVFMLSWVVSGVMLSVPAKWIEVRLPDQSAQTDISSVKLSPADIIGKLGEVAKGKNTDAIEFKKIQGRLHYSIKLDGKNYAFDAVTGEEFRFTPEMAESIIRKGFKIDAALEENKVIREHSLGYSWGPLPVSYLRFKGDFGEYYVKHENATVHRITVLSKFRVIAGQLHSFQPIRHLTGSGTLQHIILILTGIISIVGVLAGLYLVLPKRWRR